MTSEIRFPPYVLNISQPIWTSNCSNSLVSCELEFSYGNRSQECMRSHDLYKIWRPSFLINWNNTSNTSDSLSDGIRYTICLQCIISLFLLFPWAANARYRDHLATLYWNRPLHFESIEVAQLAFKANRHEWDSIPRRL